MSVGSLAVSGNGKSASIPAIGAVTSVNTIFDSMTLLQTFNFTFDASWGATPRVSFTTCCRISSLLQGNNDRSVLVTAGITLGEPINQPPVIGVPAVIQVPYSVPTTIQLVAADSTGDPLSFRFATQQESLLPTPVPVGMTMTTGGVITFIPTLVGYYSTQIRVTDSRGAYTVADLIFYSRPTVGSPVIAIDGVAAPRSISTAPGVPVTFSVQSFDPDNTAVTLFNGPLPNGMTRTPPLPQSSTTVSSTFTWTPSAGSVGGHVITFVSIDATANSTYQTVLLQVTMNAPPMVSCAAELTVPATSVTQTPFTLSVDVADPDGDALTAAVFVDGILTHTSESLSPPTSYTFAGTAGIGSHSYTFELTDGISAATSCSGTFVIADLTAPTLFLPDDQHLTAQSAGGAIATFNASATDGLDPAPSVTCTPHSGSQFPVGQTLVTCSAVDASNNLTSGSFLIVVTTATTTLANLVVPSFETVGSPVTVSTLLSRVDAPAGPLGGQPVLFTVTAPDGSTTLSGSATTAATGGASFSFTPTTRGGHTVSASFGASGTLAPSTSNIGTISIYQRTALAFSVPITGVANQPITFTAMLTAVPGGAPLADQMVSLSFNNLQPSVTMVSDAAGRVTHTVTYPSTGDFPVSAAFSNAAAFFTANGVPISVTEADANIRVTNTPPAFSAPSVPAIEATSPNGAVAQFVAVGHDAEDGPLGATCAPASGSTFPLGSTTVTCTVTDSAHATATGSFIISVQDTTPPVVTVPTVPPMAGTSAAGRAIDFTATASDLVDGVTPVACDPASGSTFPHGLTTVTCTSSDSRGNTASAGFVVTVTNNSPTFVPPANLVAEATGSAGAAVTFTAIGADLDDGPITAVCAPASGSTFPVGTTTVSCTVTDVALAVASGSFSVTVDDTIAPVLTLPASPSAPATSAGGRVVTYTASALDIVDGDRAVTCAPASGSTFPIATTTVHCSASDSRGNTSTGSFVVAVTNTAPTILDLPDLSGEATGAAGRAFTFASSGNDAEDGALMPVCTAGSGTFPIGTTTVNCSVTDAAGASSTDAFTIMVVDTTAPVLTLPTMTSAPAASADGRAVTYTASALDLVDGTTAVSCTPASGTLFPIGTTTVTCASTDAHGNSVSGSFPVTVVNNAPLFTPPADITVNATTSSGAVVTFTARGSDVEDGIIGAVCSPASGWMFRVGITTVTCTVTDSAGRAASGAFTVTVADITRPGEMRGDGFVRDDDAKYRFEFRARQNALGNARASLSIRIDHDGRRKGKKQRDDRFEARTVDAIAFSDDPAIRPGRPRRAQVDTVTFSGVGDWNGQRNCRYEVFAQDAGEPGRHHESIRVKIYSPAGAVLASFEGELDGGNIQSTRIRH